MDGLWANGARAPATVRPWLAPADSYRISLLWSGFFRRRLTPETSLIYVCPQRSRPHIYALIPGSKRANQYGPSFWSVPCYSVKLIELSF